MLDLKFVKAAIAVCPYLARTPVNKLRKMSTMPAIRQVGMPNALYAKASKCPMMKNALKGQSAGISTSSKCPYASTVDSIVEVGKPGTLSSFLSKNPSGWLFLMIELNNALFNQHQKNGVFDYETFYHQELEKKKNDRSYRYFNNINRLAKLYPTAHTGTGEHVTVWCSNDYLGMSKHPEVIEAMKYFLL